MPAETSRIKYTASIRSGPSRPAPGVRRRPRAAGPAGADGRPQPACRPGGIRRGLDDRGEARASAPVTATNSPPTIKLRPDSAYASRARRHDLPARMSRCRSLNTRPRHRAARPTRQGHEAPEAPQRARRRTQSPGTLPALPRRCENDMEVGLRGGITRCGGRQRDAFRARLADGSGSSRIRSRSQRKNSSARFCRQRYRVRA